MKEIDRVRRKKVIKIERIDNCTENWNVAIMMKRGVKMPLNKIQEIE